MEDWIKSALSQVPALSVLAFVVIKVFDWDKGNRELALKERADVMATMKTLHDEHMMARNETRNVVRECSESLRQISKEHSESMMRIAEAIRDCPLKVKDLK